ncbi:MAG: hypothetical protein F6K21_26760, partial [Symploca sp. SIO2D2]|nr:hypothetical protein [Symploca sp. SIO2D2]
MLENLEQSNWTRKNADHLFSRATFGGTPEEREAFYQLGKNEGIEAAVDSLTEATEDWSNHPYPEWTYDPEDPNGDELSSSTKWEDFTDWYIGMLRNGDPLSGKILKFL